MNNQHRGAVRGSSRIAAALSLLMLGPLSGMSFAGDWVTFRGDMGLTGASEAQLPEPVVERWRYATGSPVRVPVVGQDEMMVAVSDAGGVFAISTEGSLLWQRDLGQAVSDAPALLAGDRVIVVGDDGSVWALEAASGKQIWATSVSGVLRAGALEVVADGATNIVVMSASDGTLTGLDVRDGQPRWSSRSTNRTDGPPAASHGRVAYGNCDAAVHVFEVGKDAHVQVALGDECQMGAGAVFSYPYLFVGNRTGQMSCVDAARGTIVWRQSKGAAVFTTPAVDTELVVYGDVDGRVIALSREDGTERWVHGGGDDLSSPVLTSGHVFISDSGRLRQLRREDGRFIVAIPVSDDISAPSIVGGCVVVGTDEGDVVCFGE